MKRIGIKKTNLIAGTGMCYAAWLHPGHFLGCRFQH